MHVSAHSMGGEDIGGEDIGDLTDRSGREGRERKRERGSSRVSRKHGKP